MDAATVFYDLKTSLQANLYLLQDKERYEQGWRGQYPPHNYQKLNNKAKDNYPAITTPAIPKIVGSKLHHVSLIDKMSKTEYQAPIINDEKCL